MVNEIEPSFDNASGLPLPSWTVKDTTGALPAKPLSTFVILTARPVSRLDAVGATCAPLIDASKSSSPWGIWQLAHCLSSNCGPPGWFTPVAKFTSLWQAPQAAAVGFVR